MNFSEYKAYRDELLTSAAPQRLDCLNPFVAMAFTHAPLAGADDRTSGEAIETWSAVMGMQHPAGSVVAVNGVRAGLTALFSALDARNMELILPADVYPFYWDTARGLVRRHPIRSFETLPLPDFSSLSEASSRSLALITNPVSPLGRYLSEDEVSTLKAWLSASPDRRLALDCVYAYRNGFDASTLSLLETGQVFVFHSLSKAWLQRGVWGAVVCPVADGESWRDIFSEPSAVSSGIACAALADLSDLPDAQQALFDREWDRLMPDLMRISDGRFKKPVSGYLGFIDVDHKTALSEHGALLVPASVFGSADAGLSVASCLYSMKATYGPKSAAA